MRFKFISWIMTALERQIEPVANKHGVLLIAVLAIFSSTFTACTGQSPVSPAGRSTTLSISSRAFTEGDKIPVKYTHDGQDISPPLTWSEPPPQTQVFALIVDDPDAPGGVFTHWILFNIPASTRRLAEGVDAEDRLENGALQGKNDFGRIGYNGPSPPGGTTHRYRFTVYALDKILDLNSGASRKQLVNAMSGHILAEGRLTGVYGH